MRIALELTDGVLPLYNNPDGCLVFSETGDAVLRITAAKRVIVPMFQLHGSEDRLLLSLLDRVRILEEEEPEPAFTYIIVRGQGKNTCIVGLMRRKTEIEESMPLARNTPLINGLLA